MKLRARTTHPKPKQEELIYATPGENEAKNQDDLRSAGEDETEDVCRLHETDEDETTKEDDLHEAENIGDFCMVG